MHCPCLLDAPIMQTSIPKLVSLHHQRKETHCHLPMYANLSASLVCDALGARSEASRAIDGHSTSSFIDGWQLFVLVLAKWWSIDAFQPWMGGRVINVYPVKAMLHLVLCVLYKVPQIFQSEGCSYDDMIP